MKTIILLSILMITGCTGIPENVTAIQGFELNRYLGTWYEIARLDHSFERGLDNITATYSLREDGGVAVINKGRSQKTGEWREAEGKAYFVSESNKGKFKVSFFGPFYGAYNVIALDKIGYSYSMVTGSDRSNLWILSRKPKMPTKNLNLLIDQAKKLGYDTGQLIYVEQKLAGSK